MDTKDIQAECIKKPRSLVLSRHSFKTHDYHSNLSSSMVSFKKAYSYDDDFDMLDEDGQERSDVFFSETDIETSSSKVLRFSTTKRDKSVFEDNSIVNIVQAAIGPEAEPQPQAYEQEEMTEEGEYEEFTEQEEDEEFASKKQDLDTKIENHFIDVGSLTFGGIFGLGETLEHRVIMARTTVQCFLIPRFWLFEKINNPAGIWNRRRVYLDTNIPSREALFENFLTTRKWQKFKHDLIESNVADSLKCNPTKVQDIPIICRIVEATDD